MKISSKTDVGRVRKTNQDSYFACAFDDGSVFVVVCDGMGGASGGSEASTAAVQAFYAYTKEHYEAGGDSLALDRLLRDAAAEANRQVYEYSVEHKELHGMGTTIVAALVTQEEALVVNAGDSRAYLVDEDGVIQVTKDHSIVQDMIDSGKITPDEAATHPQKNIITRALGVAKRLETDSFQIVYPKGAALLFCTDGLTNSVEESVMAEVVKERPDDAAEELVRLANENGGGDNVTVVVVTNN